MRVGLVCPYSLTVPGGVQGQVLGLARALRAQGVEARVLGPCDGPPPDASVTPLGNSLPTASNGSIAAIAPDPAAALRTMRALRDEDFDVIHVHEPFAPGPSLTAVIVGGGPVIATFHRSGRSRWLPITAWLAKWANQWLALRVAVSEEARETAIDAFGGEYQLLWNGIDVDRYERAVAWPSDRPTIFFVGRHEPRKGLSVLIEAMSRLDPDVRLWVAGQGPDTERLKRATAGDYRIEWLGRVTEDEKIARIRASQVLCAPSLHGESFGVVLLEGMAAGTPVVATDLAGYAKVARPGVEAMMVEPDDSKALARALKTVLAGGRRVDEMVAHGRARAEQFSMHNLALAYTAMYRQVLADPERPGSSHYQ